MTLHLRARRRAAILALALAVTSSLGCGKNRVLLDIDVRSYLHPDDLVHPYDAPGLFPFTARLDSVPVNLVEGFSNFGAAQSATLEVGLTYDNASGTGTGRFDLYFAADPAALFTGEPVAVIEAPLAPATVSNGHVSLAADQRMLDLFTSKDFWMGVEMHWQPAGVELLHGTCAISQIQVHMESTLEIFP